MIITTTNEAQLAKLRRENKLMLIACLLAIVSLLNLCYTFYAPNTVLEGGSRGMINPNDTYVIQVAGNVSEECADFTYLKTECLYWTATNYVYEHVPYSYQKRADGKTSKLYRYVKYELPATHNPHYNEDVLTGRTAAVCSDMSIVLCSIMQNLNQTCELASRMVIENNKYFGHMYVKGTVNGDEIRCDPTAGDCY